MDKESRTIKSIRNSASALLMYALALAISFVSRSVFIKHLGAEVLGLNTTASSLLGFLNLTELGIGTAITFTLYKPLQENDIEKINEIVSVQGWMYRIVAWSIIVGSIILMCFFPIIFSKANLPIWYAYASYSVLLYSALLGYFVNYKQILLSASQQQYKIQFSYNIVILIKSIAQIIAVSTLPSPYIWWLILEVFFASAASYVLCLQVRKTFPWAQTNIKLGKSLRHKYSIILTKIKQLFIHKIGSFALTQTSPLVIYAFASLTMVTNYGNYMVIITGVTSVIAAFFNGMNAGIGNLVAEGDRERIMAVFREAFSSRFLIIAPAALCIFLFSNSFITFWIGEEYVLGERIVLLIVSLFFIRTTRETVDSFLNAYGLFSDIWAPALEASLNIGCSILFGYLWGLEGILCGVLLSQVVVIFCWKPVFLFSKGFNSGIRSYIHMYFKHLCMFAITICISISLIRALKVEAPTNMTRCILAMGVTYLTSTITLGGISFIFERGFRDFIFRCFRIIEHHN